MLASTSPPGASGSRMGETAGARGHTPVGWKYDEPPGGLEPRAHPSCKACAHATLRERANAACKIAAGSAQTLNTRISGVAPLRAARAGGRCHGSVLRSGRSQWVDPARRMRATQKSTQRAGSLSVDPAVNASDAIDQRSTGTLRSTWRERALRGGAGVGFKWWLRPGEDSSGSAPRNQIPLSGQHAQTTSPSRSPIRGAPQA